MLPWVVVLFVLAAALWLLHRRAAPVAVGAADPTRHRRGRPVPPAVLIVVAVLSVAAAVGSVVQVVRIGDSGAKAVWSGGFSTTPQPGQGG